MAAKIQTTELVFINSSRPRVAGPAAKATRRRGDYYMLPRSPISPTLYRRTHAPPISGSLAARRKSDYILTKGILLLLPNVERSYSSQNCIVSELEKIEPLAIRPQNWRAKESACMLKFWLRKRCTEALYFLTNIALQPCRLWTWLKHPFFPLLRAIHQPSFSYAAWICCLLRVWVRMNSGAYFPDAQFVKISWPPEPSHTIGALLAVSCSLTRPAAILLPVQNLVLI